MQMTTKLMKEGQLLPPFTPATDAVSSLHSHARSHEIISAQHTFSDSQGHFDSFSHGKAIERTLNKVNDITFPIIEWESDSEVASIGDNLEENMCNTSEDDTKNSQVLKSDDAHFRTTGLRRSAGYPCDLSSMIYQAHQSHSQGPVLRPFMPLPLHQDLSTERRSKRRQLLSTVTQEVLDSLNDISPALCTYSDGARTH